MQLEFLRLLRPLLPLGLAATAMGIASGLATAALLALTNRALQSPEGAANGVLLGFAGLCALVLLGEIASDIGTSLVGQRALARLREGLCDRILDAPIARIEAQKAHRLLAMLAEDIDTISNATFSFSSVAIATAVALGCLGYLLVLSPPLFLVVALGIGLGAAGHALARRRGLAGFAEAREAGDTLQRHYRAMLDGAKELKLNRARREALRTDGLRVTIGRIRDLRMRAIRVFVSANAFGSLLYFAMIGLILWLSPAWAGTDRGVLSGFVLVLLYLKGPVEQIVHALPLFGRAQIALRKVAGLSAGFQDRGAMVPDAPPAGFAGSIALRGATHAFPAAPGQAPFVLGPIDLQIARGETVFIVGENGCGKTTLIKLLLGLYPPGDGALLLDGAVVPPEGMDDYRQLFSAVFSDYFLFDDLPTAQADMARRAAHYLDRFEIAHRVRIEAGAFTSLDLSTGQRKRLALIQAWLEERPIMMFDEWAADQDPTFRRIFYTELLPELKRMGRTLIVVSHDDRYFDAADRIIRLQAGRIAEDRRMAPAA
ncbi:MAG TPA: cyclic peptide export ABC transporter [Roseomonas sp.]|jgi:putative ATP-binding cassette transporter